MESEIWSERKHESETLSAGEGKRVRAGDIEGESGRERVRSGVRESMSERE